MVTRDGDCEEGPPNWVANSSVEASPPALGEEGGSGLCGSVSQSYSHWNPPVSYITIPKHHVSGPPDPIPAAYKDQSSSPVNIPWTVDPNDPATQTKKVSCKITSKFKGTATEIWVDQSRLQMKVTLQTSCQ